MKHINHRKDMLRIEPELVDVEERPLDMEKIKKVFPEI